ncbi:hypothetical protein GQ43DRAFT_367820 [Delitschia confertaspora ATCC 74209]|uniref:Proteasome assembly chaperone 3 n=1 Tax=Delitschia confertaspora ATCC 74209 TaxID=1513339 RepID=A0A9P4JRF2_9PLEO|nr:hypothetical protein GQ43DRAFT_367820 [Delitschia confertaspora ATCC 74209]
MTVPDENYPITPVPFPAATKTASANIAGIETAATTISFADKILITISQNGRLAQWVHVPLSLSTTDNNPLSNSYLDTDPSLPNTDLLPTPSLTATSILGGTNGELSTLGELLATQIASAIITRDAREKRMVVLGLGLDKSMAGRERFAEIVGVVLGVL